MTGRTAFVSFVARFVTFVTAGVLSAAILLAATPHRVFPDTTQRIAVFTDQLPSRMSRQQLEFAATHYAGSQKLTLDITHALRADQSGLPRAALSPGDVAVGGEVHCRRQDWANDDKFVDTHESWFWHTTSHQRVASVHDGKLLMNVADPGFQAYWRDSILQQVRAGEYDGVFLDSASPAMVQQDARSPVDPRLTGTGVRTNKFREMGGTTWVAVWEDWIQGLDRSLEARRVALIPNVGNFSTTWDKTDYSLTSGVFSEGFSDPKLSTRDWRAALDKTLSLVRKNKIVILQNYLSSPSDVGKREYLLGSYLLVKGSRTYVSYFASSPLEWYPEWELDLGAARQNPVTLDELRWHGVYRREFAKGVVLVNPGTRPVSVTLDTPMRRVTFEGGGAVPRDGKITGRLITSPTSGFQLAPKSAEILLR